MLTVKQALLAVAAFAAALLGVPAAHAEDFIVCPSGMSGVASADTTCDFADNVRYSWYAQPGIIITAFSPVTGKTYTMQCAPAGTDLWREAKRCVGVNSLGKGLIVYIS